MRLIDLDKLLEFPIRENHYDRENGNIHYIFGIETVIEYAENLPIIESEPVRHGKNISEKGFLCSACSFGDFGGFRGYEPNYCPNCGAKMEEQDEID